MNYVTKIHHATLSCASLIQSAFSHPISLRFILILYLLSHLRPCFQNVLFTLRFSIKNVNKSLYFLLFIIKPPKHYQVQRTKYESVIHLSLCKNIFLRTLFLDLYFKMKTIHRIQRLKLKRNIKNIPLLRDLPSAGSEMKPLT
jgi:hypothetical protein